MPRENSSWRNILAEDGVQAIDNIGVNFDDTVSQSTKLFPFKSVQITEHTIVALNSARSKVCRRYVELYGGAQC